MNISDEVRDGVNALVHDTKSAFFELKAQLSITRDQVVSTEKYLVELQRRIKLLDDTWESAKAN